jgi:adenylyltransferase/sulfurtransferase
MSSADALRYARQIRLPDVGIEGQRRLAGAAVLVVGAGGLGAPALHHLVASGVGRVGFVEFDHVDVTNLHRQTLYTTSDVGRPKAEAARDRLEAINPEITVEAHPVRLGAGNAEALLADYDLVLDGSDTFATRYVVNDASVRTGTPNVFASVSQFSGQISVFGTETGPCYRCLFPDPPPPDLIPNCEDGGVLGVVPSLFGTLQAAEALKWLLEIGTPLVGRLLMIDALTMDVREIAVDRDPQCPTCGDAPARRAPTDNRTEPAEITVAELRARNETDPPVLVDVREASEHHADNIGGRLIPLGQLEVRAFELDDVQDQEIVVYCASGGRSAVGARLLRERGLRARSLRGGMEAWNALS